MFFEELIKSVKDNAEDLVIFNKETGEWSDLK